MLNLNTRNIYNKINEFKTFVDEEKIDLDACLKVGKGRILPLKKLLMEDFQVISNVYQRRGKGGRPAIIVNSRKFQIENLTQTVVSIPWEVEAVWAVLTPKNVTNASRIQKIIVMVSHLII